jgi:hypothetical protein
VAFQAALRFALLLGLYLLLAGQLSTDEAVAGAVGSAVLTLVSLIVRAGSDRQFRFTGIRWLTQPVSALVTLPGETTRVALRLMQPVIVGGAVQSKPAPTAANDPPSRATRAVAILCASLAPNSFVVAELPARREFLVHVLVRGETNPRAPA